MNELSNESLSVTFYHGEKIVLTPLWHDKNVISPNSKLYYIIDGELIVETPKEKLIGKRGDVILIPAGVKHNFHLTEKNYAKKYWFHFDLKKANNSIFELYSLPYKIHIGVNSSIINLFNTVIKHATGKGISNSLAVTGAVMTILSYYIDKCAITEKKTQDDEMDKAINYIKNNYRENYTLEELSRFVNLSPSYFLKKFKKRTEHSPIQFVKMIKLERAKFLLEQSHESVGAIMEQLGFFDAAHFSKIFKQRYGHSPRKYREIYNYNKAN